MNFRISAQDPLQIVHVAPIL